MFEKVVKRRIVKFIKSTERFDKRQYGFLENSSTEGTIMDVLGDITRNLDTGKYAVAIFLDF